VQFWILAAPNLLVNKHLQVFVDPSLSVLPLILLESNPGVFQCFDLRPQFLEAGPRSECARLFRVLVLCAFGGDQPLVLEVFV
jgi:hypothetical protein